MRHLLPWCGCSLVVLNACADAASDEEARELKAFLADTASTAAEPDGLNAAFARQAVRAWGYRRAGVDAPDSEAWFPVASVDATGAAPSDVSPWLDAGDITGHGTFAPCLERECPAVTLSDEQRRVLAPWLGGANALRKVDRLSGAALRLLGNNGEIRWVPGLDVGIALHPAERVAEVNPRLIELVNGAPPPGRASSATPSAEVALGQDSVQQPAPAPAPASTNPVLRSHEPPAGHSSGSSGDCDCDCDFIDVRCAIEPHSAGRDRHRALSRQLFLALTAVALLLRRRRRTRRSPRIGHRGIRAWAMRVLSLLVLGLVADAASAETADTMSRLTAGKAHLARKDYAAAIGELEAARAGGLGREVLEPLATAYDGAGRRPEAYAALGELLRDEASLKPPDRERLRRQRELLETRLAFINVQVQPAGATVLVDGGPAIVDPRSKQIVVVPGPHHVSARAEGFVDAGKTVLIQPASRDTVVTLALAATVTAQAPAAPQTAALRPPKPAEAPRRVYKFRSGPYVVGQLGFAILTARPSGFHYETRLNEETNQPSEQPGLTSLFGVTAGYRLTRGVGIGGLVMYGRGGGEGTVSQIELGSGGGSLSHEGPADFTQQAFRIGPHFRFMAGGDRVRFLAGTSLGVVYAWLDLDHADVTESGGVLVEQGTFHHHYSGINPFGGFDLGVELNMASHLLLGIALDVIVERTANLSGNPFGGTAQGYFGFSARAGFHDWGSE